MKPAMSQIQLRYSAKLTYSDINRLLPCKKKVTSDLFVEKPKLSGGLKEMRILKTTQSGFTGNSFVM